MHQHPHGLAILGRIYQLPALPPRLRDLPELIAKRADLVQTGEEVRPRWLGLFKRRPKQLSIEQSYNETEALINDYQWALQHLSQHRPSYHRFFFKLAEGVQSAVRQPSHRCPIMSKSPIWLS